MVGRRQEQFLPVLVRFKIVEAIGLVALGQLPPEANKNQQIGIKKRAVPLCPGGVLKQPAEQHIQQPVLPGQGGVGVICVVGRSRCIPQGVQPLTVEKPLAAQFLLELVGPQRMERTGVPRAVLFQHLKERGRVSAGTGSPENQPQAGRCAGEAIQIVGPIRIFAVFAGKCPAEHVVSKALGPVSSVDVVHQAHPTQECRGRRTLQMKMVFRHTQRQHMPQTQVIGLGIGAESKFRSYLPTAQVVPGKESAEKQGLSGLLGQQPPLHHLLMAALYLPSVHAQKPLGGG